jgi:hypothetical protein
LFKLNVHHVKGSVNFSAQPDRHREGITLNQRYLVPNFGSGDFGVLHEVSRNGLTRALHFYIRLKL